MNILLFGGSGQLGLEIVKRGFDLNFQIVSPVISEIDIGSVEQVTFLAEKVQPELVINCAAYTAVDKAEADRAEAFRVNRDGAANVARAAKRVGAQLIHISTDYVFGPGFSSPISEEAPTNPPNVYGASKLAGEEEVRAIWGDRSAIVRTSSLHGQRGENFVHTMLRLMTERESVSVVTDQIMSPTWAGWLAEVILDLGRVRAAGTFHASCAGAISWFEFAEAIQELADPQRADGSRCRLLKTTAAEFKRPAARANYSAFDTSKLARLLGRAPIPWRQGLEMHLAELGKLSVKNHRRSEVRL